MKTAVLILNVIGLNWLSRFITGHLGTGILILLLDILSIATFWWVGIIIGCIIWIVDIVNVCTNRWMYNGQYLTEWSGNAPAQNVQSNNTNYYSNPGEFQSQIKKDPFYANNITREENFCRFCGRELTIEKNVLTVIIIENL